MWLPPVRKNMIWNLLKEELLALPLEGKIVGIMHIINDSLSDVVQSDETQYPLRSGLSFMKTLLGLRFKISTFSFFQPNSLGCGSALFYCT